VLSIPGTVYLIVKGDDYVIERAGKPLVAIIPMEKYQSLRQEMGEFSESLSKMRANLRREDERNMDELIREAVGSYKKSKARSKR
jgi:L-lactate utilization protein LutC